VERSRPVVCLSGLFCLWCQVLVFHTAFALVVCPALVCIQNLQVGRMHDELVGRIGNVQVVARVVVVRIHNLLVGRMGVVPVGRIGNVQVVANVVLIRIHNVLVGRKGVVLVGRIGNVLVVDKVVPVRIHNLLVGRMPVVLVGRIGNVLVVANLPECSPPAEGCPALLVVCAQPYLVPQTKTSSPL